MERILLRVLLCVVCVAGALLSIVAVGTESLNPPWLQRLSAISSIVLVASLLSLAAAQAWDRGARALAAGAILLLQLGALLAVVDVCFPPESFVFRLATGVIAGAAFVTVVLCGLVVVEAPRRDRWIGRVAASAFVVTYLAVVWTKTNGGDRFLARVVFVALAVGVTATAAYSIRARLARLATVPKPPSPS